MVASDAVERRSASELPPLWASAPTAGCIGSPRARSPAQVGHRLGFTEPTNFLKFFKRMAGRTPFEFRESHAAFDQQAPRAQATQAGKPSAAPASSHKESASAALRAVP